MLLSSLIALGLLALAFGLALGYAAVRFKVEGDPLVDQVDAILPQTQCGQCGYPGCRPYAEAIANGDDINECIDGRVEIWYCVGCSPVCRTGCDGELAA